MTQTIHFNIKFDRNNISILRKWIFVQNGLVSLSNTKKKTNKKQSNKKKKKTKQKQQKDLKNNIILRFLLHVVIWVFEKVAIRKVIINILNINLFEVLPELKVYINFA